MPDANARPDWMPPDDMPAGGYVLDYLGFWLVLLVLATVAAVYLFRVWHRGGRRTPFTRTVGIGLVALATLWAAVVAGETYLRYVYDASDSYGLVVTNRAWMRRHAWEANILGLRDVAFDPKPAPPGVTRILFVGDSFTWGYGVRRMADRFPDRIRSRLGERRPGAYEVLNLSEIGLHTGQEAGHIELFHERYGMNRVVLAYCLNDLEDLLPQEARFRRGAVERPGWIDSWTSFLFDFLWFRIRIARDPRVTGYFDWVEDAYEDDELWARQVARFRRIRTFCAENRVGLSVVVFPFFNSWGPDYPFHGAHDRVRDTWEALGVRVVDLRETYRGLDGEDLVAGRYDAHPNAYAHDLAARTVLRELFPR